MAYDRLLETRGSKKPENLRMYFMDVPNNTLILTNNFDHNSEIVLQV